VGGNLEGTKRGFFAYKTNDFHREPTTGYATDLLGSKKNALNQIPR